MTERALLRQHEPREVQHAVRGVGPEHDPDDVSDLASRGEEACAQQRLGVRGISNLANECRGMTDVSVFDGGAQLPEADSLAMHPPGGQAREAERSAHRCEDNRRRDGSAA